MGIDKKTLLCANKIFEKKLIELSKEKDENILAHKLTYTRFNRHERAKLFYILTGKKFERR